MLNATLYAVVLLIARYKSRSYPMIAILKQEPVRSAGPRSTRRQGQTRSSQLATAGVEANGGNERVLSVRELAAELKVSTKTISRWQRRGLVSRPFTCDGRKRLGFLQSEVDGFIARNRDRVARAARFSQLTLGERKTIFEQAQRLSAAGVRPSLVGKQLARMTGRSLETIRYTLKRLDREYPEAGILTARDRSLPLDTKRTICRLFLGGETIQSLSKQLGRAKSTIARVIAEMRAQRIAELPLDYIPNPQFPAFARSRELEKQVLGSMPLRESPAARSSQPAGLAPYLASLYEVPLLTREQELHLFRKLNYLKYKAGKLRAKLDVSQPDKAMMTRIERLHEEIVATKNQIISANLRLVVAIAKRHIGVGQEFFELVSDGNVSLMHAVERFDYSMGNKFSTYATWAIIKNFARSISDEMRRRDRFRTDRSDLFAETTDVRADQRQLESQQSKRELALNSILERLDKREREVIACRFGLRHDREPLTLKQVGDIMGVTKERIRQIEVRALKKLRNDSAREKLAMLLDGGVSSQL